MKRIFYIEYKNNMNDYLYFSFYIMVKKFIRYYASNFIHENNRILIIITYYISYITELTIYNGLTITAIQSLIYELVILHQKYNICVYVLNYLKRKKKNSSKDE